MPPRQKPSKAALARLDRLERRPDLVIEGGLRPLGIYVREGKQTLQPRVALWLDAQSGFIRGTRVIEPQVSADESVREALEALVEALTDPVVAPAPSQAPAPAILLPNGTMVPPRLAPPPPALPARIRVNDAALAEAAHAIFDPLDVAIEQPEELPAFDAAFQEMSRALGANPDPNAAPPEPFSWQIDRAVLPPLYAAAARYARRAPWEYMPDHPPLAVTLGDNGPQPGVETLYASIMGGGGQVTGIAFYYSLDDFQQVLQRGAEMEPAEYDDEQIDEAITMLRQAGAPIEGLPPDELREAVSAFLDMTNQEESATPEIHENSLVFFLEERDESDPTYVDWLKERGLKFTRENVPFFLKAVPGQEPYPPDEREVKALASAIEAIERFFKQFGQQIATGMIPLTGYALTEVATDTGTVREVRFPPAGYDWSDVLDEIDADEDEDEDDAEEPDEPAPAGAASTLYRLQVSLAWKKSVWRRIELRGDQTLHDLHGAIQEAFDWDDDHLYAFFLSGRAWDSDSEYESPYGAEGRNAARYRLASLPLRQGQKFLYIFDFGDELQHHITLEAVTPGGVEAGAAYPRIVERHGASVPQYGE